MNWTVACNPSRSMEPDFSAVITDFNSLRPKYETSQELTINWLVAAHRTAETILQERLGNKQFLPEEFENHIRKYLARYGCSTDRISRRGHETDDFLHLDWEKMKLFNLKRLPQGAGTGSRTDFFAQAVEDIFSRLYPWGGEAVPPEELIHVTCTGYVAPSGAQKLVEKRGWSTTTAVTHLYHMGCGAALPALRISSGLLTNTGKKRADIVHTELCTIHLNPTVHTPEQLIIQSLFSDGFIRYSVLPYGEFSKNKNSGLNILAIQEEILPDSSLSMKWACSDWGMKMSLLSDVPDKIALRIREFLAALCDRAGVDFFKERESAVFAIHPGGPKIVDNLASLLELRENQVAASNRVLYRFGNMSSATLPYIWKAITEDPSIDPGTLVISLAFAPGLTVYGAVLRKV